MLNVPLDGVEAKLSIAIQAAAEQSKNDAKMRGLKNADCDWVFFRISVILGCVGTAGLLS